MTGTNPHLEQRSVDVPQRVLLTGAAGGIGTLMRPRLARPDRVLRLLDIAPVSPAVDGEQVEVVRASVTDLAAMRTASTDVDVILHLGGLSVEGSWSDMLDVNIQGTYVVLEAG